jgi:hypothetical protein
MSGKVPVPDWLGALVLKARAAVELDGRERHVRDFALLLCLPVDIHAVATATGQKERGRLSAAVDLLDATVWDSLPPGVDQRTGQAAAQLICASPSR